MLKVGNVPNELKQLNNWVLQKDKIPYDAKTLKMAKSNDASTWSDFTTAYTTLINEPSFHGLGFMLSNDIICVDLDNKEDEMPEEEFKALLHEVLDEIPSYCEISMSGKGYHVFAKGKLPDGYRKKKHIEMYDSNRYIAFTGNIYGSFKQIKEAQDGINKIHAKYLGSRTITVTPEDVEVAYDNESGLTIDDVLNRGRNNDKFMRLYNGEWEALGFPSQSEADASFSSLLAIYTGNDIKLMDEVFRSSKLYRAKFDERRGKKTYGTIILESAVSWVMENMDLDLVHGELVTYKTEPRQTEESEVEVIIDNDTKTSQKPDFAGNRGLITPSRFTDTANAQQFLQLYGDEVKYNFENKAWYLWSGKHWQWDETDQIKRYAEYVGNEMLDFAKKNMDDAMIKNALRTLNVAGKRNMIEEAKHQENVAVLNRDLDTQKFMINTLSGVYDLESDSLLPHHKDFYLTKLIETEIVDKKPKKWLKFMHEVFLDDMELIKYIQKAVGYSLTGSIKEQVIFILHGGGNNGKSIFIDTLQAMMGDYATSVPIEVLMERKGGVNIETTLARIKGARVIHASESDEDDAINEGFIKQITGGEQVVGRFLYGNQFTYYPEYKLWLSTNNKPMIKGTDFGIWRRIIVIPFNYTIPEHKVNKDLMDELREELPLILNWAIEGYRLYVKEGLKVPQVILDERDKYRSEMDFMANFIEDRLEKKEGYQIQASIVYKEYEKWCRKTNSKVLSSVSFGKEFGKHFDKRRSSSGFMYLDCFIKVEETDYTLREYKGVNRND